MPVKSVLVQHAYAVSAKKMKHVIKTPNNTDVVVYNTVTKPTITDMHTVINVRSMKLVGKVCTACPQQVIEQIVHIVMPNVR
mmetsp:Transcript_105870/g.297679  ORF Transcript_105870/g.297679 Transcript_105870/m.297679 type:complete len:82 (+) Transcript_105870:394-639(+)